MAWARLSDAFAEFGEAHPRRFEPAGIEVEAIQRCFVEASAEFGDRQWGREWRLAESIVCRHPWPIAAFFRPDLVRDGAVRKTQPSSGL